MVKHHPAPAIVGLLTSITALEGLKDSTGLLRSWGFDFLLNKGFANLDEFKILIAANASKIAFNTLFFANSKEYEDAQLAAAFASSNATKIADVLAMLRTYDNTLIAAGYTENSTTTSTTTSSFGSAVTTVTASTTVVKTVSSSAVSYFSTFATLMNALRVSRLGGGGWRRGSKIQAIYWFYFPSSFYASCVFS